MTEELFYKAPCGYFAFYDDGSIIEVNDTLATTLNYSRDFLIGKNVETLLTLASRIFYQTHFFPLIKLNGKADEIFLTVQSSDGQQLPVLLNASRTMLNDQMATLCAFIVVPNRKKFEDELLNARRTAERALKESTALLRSREEYQVQAERLERQMQQVKRQNNDLNQFSYAVTHNLKEPLRKVLLFTTKLEKEWTSPTLDKVRKSTDQLKEVVNGLQQYVWLNAKVNTFSKVDLNAVVQSAYDELSRDLSQDLMSLSLPQLDALDADFEQLQLMFYNLLSNAVRFRKGPLANVSVTSTLLKKNSFTNLQDKYKYVDYIRIEVRDEGLGFDPLYRSQIFDLFKKLDSNSGQGLGLALCRKVAENHYGFIEAESEVDSFTKIIIWLPARQDRTTI